jgi:hypothetical protein
MKITLTIDTTEPYSGPYNLFQLLEMALEVAEDSAGWKQPTTGGAFTISGKEGYKYGVEEEKPRKAKAKVRLEVVK